MNLTMEAGPGKFQGEPVLTRILYDLSMYGGDDECGSVDGLGWAGLLRGPFKIDSPFSDLTPQTRAELSAADLAYLRTLAGVILTERTDGFVSADYFTNAQELERAWRLVCADYNEAQDSDRDA